MSRKDSGSRPGFSLKELIRSYEAKISRNEPIFFDIKSFEKIIDYYESILCFDRGLQAAECALNYHPYSASFFIKKALFLFLNKGEEEALEVLEQAKILDNQEIEIYLLSSDIYASLDNKERAMDELRIALKFADPEELADIYLQVAEISEQFKNKKSAFTYFKKAFEASPHHYYAHERLLIFIEENKLYEQGVEFHSKVLDKDPFAAFGWFNLGICYQNLELYEKGIEAFSFANALKERWEDPIREMGDCHYELKNYSKALDLYLEALEICKRDDELYYNIGMCHYHLENKKKSFYYFNKALKLDPDYEEVYFQLGELHRTSGELLSALKCYKKSIDLNGENVEYIEAFADLSGDLGNSHNAIENYLKALHLDPSKQDLWLKLAVCYRQAACLEQAELVLNKASEVFNEAPEIICLLFVVIYEKGKAQAAYEILSEIFPTSFDARAFIIQHQPDLCKQPSFIQFFQQYQSSQ